MMRIGAIVLAVSVLATGVASAETRRVNNVSAINAVDLSGRFRTEIVRGDNPGATLEGTSGDLDKIGIRISNGELRLWEKCTMFCGRRDLDVVVRIVTPRLSAIDVAKGAEVQVADLNTDSLSIDVTMGGTVKASGVCSNLSADVSMGGSLAAANLACRKVSADASMGGAATVRASEMAVVDASMGGAVTVHGAPPKFEGSGSMGGSVSRAD